MPTVIATWCEQAGHNVHYICFTGFEDLRKELPLSVDLVFIGSFTQSAYLAYALSNMLRSRGAVTVLGGPHARCFPDDAVNYFDYVLGFTDKTLVINLLENFEPGRPNGNYFSAAKQPTSLPSVIERWKFIELNLRKAPVMKIIGMIGSMGCP